MDLTSPISEPEPVTKEPPVIAELVVIVLVVAIVPKPLAIEPAANVPTAVTCVCEASTFNVFPDLVRPVPSVICPAPENWINVREVTPIDIVPVFVQTNPLFALVVPSSTKKKAPLTSVLASKSVALVGAPLAFTV